MVKKLVDRYNSEIFYPKLEAYSGLYDFSSFENFLYEQLRRVTDSSPERVSFLSLLRPCNSFLFIPVIQ